MTITSDNHQFEAVLEKHPDLDASYFTIPFSVLEVFGMKGQVKVKVTINQVEFPGLLAPMGGVKHVLGIRKELRKTLGIIFGDLVSIALKKDAEPRIVTLPEDLQNLLLENAETKAAFDKLSYAHRREFVHWLEEAKKPETRQRRLQLIPEKLRKKM